MRAKTLPPRPNNQPQASHATGMMDWEDDMRLDCDEMLDDSMLDTSAPTMAPSEAARLALEELDKHQSYRAMLHQELARPDFTRKYEYLKYRRVLVDWMSEVGEEMRIRKTTIHTAIAYLERVLTVGKMPAKDRFQLLALSCIMIAAKYLGPEDDVPTVAEFYEFGNRCYSYAEIHEMELSTLSKLGWSLTSLTPIHFSRYYLSQPVLFSDDEIQGADMVDEALEYYQKYNDFFADLCLQEYQFQAYRPSLIAASILAASRKTLGMTPLWREELTLLTGYTADQVEPCFSAIWSHYVATFGDSTKSSAASREVSPTSVAEYPY